MSKIIRKRAKVPCFVISDYVLRLPESPKRLILLLHGFTETGEIVFKRLNDLFDEDDAVLAPNGPFPFPEKKKDHYKMGFAWYLFDNLKNEYFIDFELPSLMLKNLIEQLELSSLPKIVIGYSQGGYLAAFAANSLSDVKSVIGMACVFRDDMLKINSEFPIHGIHGSEDLLVDPKRAETSHEKLNKRGIRGSFTMLPDEGHRLTPAFKKQLKSLI